MTVFKKWLCVICGLIYDEAEGWPSDGIVAGTRWADVPEDWMCPDCGVGKADFEMIELPPEDEDEGEAVAQPPAAPPASAPVVQAPVAMPRAVPVSAPATGPIVIIGTGHAGYGLASALRERDREVAIHLVTADDGDRYSKPMLSNAFATGRDARALRGETALEVEARLGVRVHARCRVLSVDPAARRLETDLGPLSYGSLVLATGAAPIRLPVSGAETLLPVNDLADHARLRARLEGARHVAIVGGGLIGCEFANDLAAAGLKVTIVECAPRLMDALLPEAAAAALRRGLEDAGVTVRTGVALSSVATDADGVVLTVNGEAVRADVGLSAVGLAPRLDLARAAGVDVGRGIRVDDCLRTSVTGIFALGDAIEIDGRPQPYLAPINQGAPALAATLLGRPTPVCYPPAPVVVKTPAAPVTVLPPPVGLAGFWHEQETADGVTAGFWDVPGTLRGFALVGRSAQSRRAEWLAAAGRSRRNVA